MSRLQNKTSIPTIVWVMIAVMFAGMMATFAIVQHIVGQKSECTIINTAHTVRQGEFLSDIALREIKAQKVKWDQSISFNQLIQETVVSIQIASHLNSSTPSAGTVIQIPDLNDPGCLGIRTTAIAGQELRFHGRLVIL